MKSTWFFVFLSAQLFLAEKESNEDLTQRTLGNYAEQIHVKTLVCQLVRQLPVI